MRLTPIGDDDEEALKTWRLRVVTAFLLRVGTVPSIFIILSILGMQGSFDLRKIIEYRLKGELARDVS